MEEEKFYLTMSAVGRPDEIVQALTELLTSMKTTSISDMPNMTTHGNGQVLMCSKKQYYVKTSASL
jgi:hypothetical protein